MALERKDIITDEAVQVPLVVADNFLILKKTIEEVFASAEKTKLLIGDTSSVTVVKNAVSSLVVEQKELSKIQSQIAVATAKNTEEYRKYEEELARVKKETKENKEIGAEEAKLINAKTASIKQLGAALSKNKQAYAELNSAQSRNSKEGKELLSTIQKQDKEYKKLQESIGNTGVNVGNYTESIKNALGPLSVFTGHAGTLGPALSSMASGMGTASKASNVLKASMLAIPIFALIVAITALVQYFTKTQEGAEKLRVILAAVEGVFELITDALAKMGKALSELTLDKVVQGFKDLGNTIVNFVLKSISQTLEGFGKLGTAFGLLFKGEFKEAAKVAADGVLQIVKNATPLGLVIQAGTAAVEVLGEVIDEVNEKIKEEVHFQTLLNQLIRDRRAFVVEEAKLQTALNESREKTADAALADEEKLLELRRQKEILDELELKRISLLQRELDIVLAKSGDKIKNGLEEETTLDHIAELQKEILNAQAQRAADGRKLAAQTSALELKIIEDNKKATLAAIAETQTAYLEAAKARINEEAKVLDAQIQSVKQAAIAGKITREKAEEEILQIQKDTGRKLIEANIAELENQLRIQMEFAQRELDVANLSAEEKKKLEADNAKERALLEKQLYDFKGKLIDHDYQHTAETREKDYAATEEALEKTADLYNEFAQGAGSLFSSISEGRIADLEHEETLAREKMERELEAAGNNEEAKAQIQNTFAKKEAEIGRKKLAEQRKAALFDKAVSSVQAAIAVALAIVKTLPNIPLSIAVGAFGAAQVAAILSKPIPAFKKGGELKNDSLFIAGERKKELVVEPSGAAYLTGDKAGLFFGPRGTKIFSHDDTLAALALSALSSNGGKKARRNEELAGIGKKLDTLNKTIKTKPSVLINFSKQGAEAVFRNGESRTKFLNDFFK